MFDISALKEMKLSELQEIAKLAKTIKTTGVKKEVLIEQILEQQAKAAESSKPKAAEKPAKAVAEDKPKRTRILPEKKGAESQVQNDLFADNILDETPVLAEAPPLSIAEKHLNKTLKFKKPAIIPKSEIESQPETATENTEIPSEDNTETPATAEQPQAKVNINPNQKHKDQPEAQPIRAFDLPFAQCRSVEWVIKRSVICRVK